MIPFCKNFHLGCLQFFSLPSFALFMLVVSVQQVLLALILSTLETLLTAESSDQTG